MTFGNVFFFLPKAGNRDETAPEVIVAVGGGHNSDTANAVGIIATHGGIIQDFEGLDTIRSPLPHFYDAVSSTAGCGSDERPCDCVL